MTYKLSKKILGSSKMKLLAEIDIPLRVRDFCFVDGLGYVFLLPEHHCLALYDVSNKKTVLPWIGSIDKKGCVDGVGQYALLDKPYSICGQGVSKVFFLVEKNGKLLRQINTNERYVSSCWGSATASKINLCFSKTRPEELHIVSSAINDTGDVFWSNDTINSIFRFNNSNVDTYIGYKRGYSVASHLRYCEINGPTSLACDGDSVYFSDTKNYCIRKIVNNTILVVAGKPLEQGDIDGPQNQNRLMGPSNLRIKKDIMCFMDAGKVKYFSFVDKSVGSIYKSDKLVSIELDKNKSLVVLEKI